MRSPQQDRSKLASYAVVIALCVCALGAALLNGVSRGHWFRFGIFADAVICVSMVSLFLREKQKHKS